MKVYTMALPKSYLVKFCTCHCLSHTSCLLSSSLFCYISGLNADTGGIAAIFSDNEVQNVRQDTEEGRTQEEKPEMYLPTWMACDRIFYYILHVCQ